MQLKRQSIIGYIFYASLVLTVCVSGCCQKVVMIGSPYDRYDHNRARKIEVKPFGESGKIAIRRVVDEVYAPSGSVYFPAAEYESSAKGADGLGAANVVPIFTGISLPLSAEPVAGVMSDREDLIDYLAEGPDSQRGVEQGDMSGDRRSVEISYKPVLELLESQAIVGENETKLTETLSSMNAEVADNVIDPRYGKGAFKKVLAFKYGKFWFVLFKLPDHEYFSRLVVVPVQSTRQDLKNKRI